MIDDNNRGRKDRPSTLRFSIIVFFLLAAAILILIRYGMIMLSYSDPASQPQKQTLLERGPILDRNGQILALQTRLGNITVWRPEVTDLMILSQELEGFIDLDAATIRERIVQSSSDFIYLQKRVDASKLRAIETALEAGKLPGVGIEAVVGRIYPEKRLAGALIGFVGDGNEGLAGIEYAFEEDLAPQDGRAYGGQVILTIDAKVQHILEEIAQKTLEENEAEGVMMIALDPRTGDILGSASMPDYDPNNIRESDEKSRMDRPAIWAYEPGSVFKIFSLSAIMDTGLMDENSTFICDGKYEQTTASGEKIVIKCLGNHGSVGVKEIITYSCNSGAAYASDLLSQEAFYKALRDFGFGGRTGAGNPGETAGFLRPVERWSGRSKPTIAIGQEIAVSALQMVQAASAIANDGVLVRPRIVSRVLSSDGRILKSDDTLDARRVLKKETAVAMRRFMEEAASEAGTGRRAGMEDLALAVKTGTAQFIDPATGTYSSTDFIASCLAMLPADEPLLIIYNVIIKPKGASYLGGRIAAPPVREAAEALVDYLGIPRGKNPQAEHPGTVVVGMDKTAELGDTMPDFRGYSKRELLPLLLRDDIKIEISGDGWVRKQSPEPGLPINSETTIQLELE